MERWKSRDTIYNGKIFEVQTGIADLGDGRESPRDIVLHNGGVGIVPFTGHSVLFAQQYRIAVGETILEIPAGKLEGDESPEHRGRTELIEEIGYEAGTMIPAGFIYPSVGFLTEKIHIFLAFDLTQTEAQPEWDEEIEVIELPLEDIRARLRNNHFTDAKTIAGLHALFNHLES